MSSAHHLNSSHSNPPTDPSAPVVLVAAAVALADWPLEVAEKHSLRVRLDSSGSPVSRNCNPAEQVEAPEVEAAVASQVVVDFVIVNSATDGVMM